MEGYQVAHLVLVVMTLLCQCMM